MLAFVSNVEPSTVIVDLFLIEFGELSILLEDISPSLVMAGW